MAEKNLNKNKILLVEDEAAIAKPLMKLLQIRGYETNWAKDGLDALKLLKENTDYRCLLIDIMMPRMDGWQLGDKLRESDAYTELPFIFLSADSRSAKEAKRRAEAFVSKPINLSELENKLKELIHDSSEF